MDHRRRFMRLGLAVGAILAAAITFIYLFFALWQQALEWLEGQPDYQIAFREITLDPPPPPWYRGGAPAFLDHVRTTAGLPEKLSVIDETLLLPVFRKYPWVRRADGVRRSHGRKIVVRLEYREPVVKTRDVPNTTFVLDRDAVLLPTEDIDWETIGPLVSFRPAALPASPRPGEPWKTVDKARSEPRVDSSTLAVAQLAAFLQEASRKTPRGELPGVVALLLNDEGSVFIQFQLEIMVQWSDPPGDTRGDEPSPEEKWRLLREWFQLHGTKAGKHPDYLGFKKNRVVIHQG